MIHVKKQRGISLLEITIALSLGLILLAGLISVYLFANRSSGEASFVSQMDQSADSIFYRIGHDAGLAGSIDLSDKPKVSFKNKSGNICLNSGDEYSSLLGNIKNPVVSDIYTRTLTSTSYNERKSLDFQDNRYMTLLGLSSCGNMQPVIGCGGNLSPNPTASGIPTCSPNSSGNTQQQIQFAYQGIDADSEIGGLPNSTKDCTGTIINSGDINKAETLNGFIVNRYYLAEDAKTKETAFKCRGNAFKNEVSLVDGVSELTFRYATTSLTTEASTDLSSLIVSDYQDASALNSASSENSYGWSQVVGIDVCFILSAPVSNQSGEKALATLQGNTRQTCKRNADGSFEADVDKENNNRFYRRYNKVIALPNMIYLQTDNYN